MAAKTLKQAKYGYNRCDNCRHFSGGRCKMFDAPVRSNYVCNEWDSRGVREVRIENDR